MFKSIDCPSCHGKIEGENFHFSSEADMNRFDEDGIEVVKVTPWYKFNKLNMYCPHCKVRLAYDPVTQNLIYCAAFIFIAMIGVLIYLGLPSSLFFFGLLIFPPIVYGRRKLVVYNKT